MESPPEKEEKQAITPHKKIRPEEPERILQKHYIIWTRRRYVAAPTAAVQGMVITQADTIW